MHKWQELVNEKMALLFITHLNSGLLNRLVHVCHYVILASLVPCSGLSDETTWANKILSDLNMFSRSLPDSENSLIHAHSWQSIHLHRWSELGHTVLFILGAPAQTKLLPAAYNFRQIYLDCKNGQCKWLNAGHLAVVITLLILILNEGTNLFWITDVKVATLYIK